MLSELKPALRLLLVLTVLTGVAYPIVVTGLAQALFPFQANGSLIDMDGKIIGSALIGQRFSQDRYFHSRPSAAGAGNDASQSNASNLAPTSRKLIDDLTARAAVYRAEYAPGKAPLVPIDLVTMSASGLDPDISPAAALFQVPRVARARHMDEEQVRMLVVLLIEKRAFAILGEPRLNLLKLNIALDEMGKGAPSQQ